MSIINSLDFSKDIDKLVDLLNDKTGYVLTQNDYDEILYRLKLIYYENEDLEKLLCDITQKLNWKVPNTIEELVHQFQSNRNQNGKLYPLLGENFANFLLENANRINKLKQETDKNVLNFSTSIFGLETLNAKYLLKNNATGYQENINYMWLRVCLFIAEEGKNTDWERIRSIYEHLKMGYYTHATATLFNSGTKNPQLASCFRAGTNVLTVNGYKQIETVKVGDMVWTHGECWKQVLQCHENVVGDRKILKIKFNNFWRAN